MKFIMLLCLLLWAAVAASQIGKIMDFIVTCMPGLAPLLAKELTHLGHSVRTEGGAAVALQGDAQAALHVCLWSRVAERVLLPLCSVQGEPFDVLPELVAGVDWPYWGERQMPVHWVVEHGPMVKGDHRISRQRLMNLQPSTLGVQKSPQGALCLRAVLNKDGAALYVDLSGDTLQRRGYRLAGGAAPLRETLAAAMLWALDWPTTYGQQPVLVDPFCGSGTLLIEAAGMALEHAPGLLREHHGFQAWPAVAEADWQALVAEAEARRQQSLEGLHIAGFDSDHGAIQAAKENAHRAGVGDAVEFTRRQLAELTREDFAAEKGLLVANPPWGERLEEQEQAGWLYYALGRTLARFASQWQALLVASQAEVLDRAGMQVEESWRVKNGPFQVYLRRLTPLTRPLSPPLAATGELAFELPDEALPMVNRLRKNSRQLRRWLEQSGTQAYRLYDRDLPEFNVTVDVYGDAVLVNEFAPPKTIAEDVAKQRRSWALMAIRAALGVHREQVFIRTRRQQKGTEQYERVSQAGELRVVEEGRARVLVNLQDYLDTGLFLDHRPIRLHFSTGIAQGKRFLNLFGYTGVATLQAALGGARRSITVDASKKYLDWASNNLAANGIALAAHAMVRADVLQWLAESRDEFDVIFCDPPTFSNSTGRKDFSVQEDHVALIEQCMQRLHPQGVLYFSCNFRRFQLAAEISEQFVVEDITRWSIPPDFSRNTKIHVCFAIRHKG